MGDSARFVLKGIEGMLQTEVKFFSMVRRDGERMYICLGKRALFLLDFEPPFQEQFYYAWITQVIIDSENLLLFQLDFSEGRPSLVLESFERERLCEELAICWKADFMFRKWTWQTFSLKRGLCDIVKRERTASEFTTPPDKMQKMEMTGYFMFADEAFRADPPGPDGQPTGCYRLTGRDTELKFIVECPQSVAQLGRREKDLLRLAAERVARSMSADSEMMVLRSEQYHKRMNLMGDLASWACWTVHLRTPQLDIGVIATRRKYIPPVGDQYQDLFIVQTDDVETRESAELFMQGLERQADTLSPLVRVPFYDDTITRIKADALLYDEDSFSWFQAEDILSVNQDAARAFYKSVANLLVQEKEADYDLSTVEKDTVLIDDPFRVVTALWEEAPGLKDDSDPRAWANWRQRVARFLYWAVDGGLHPGEMTLDMLIKCERRQSCSLRARDILQRLFDFFIHMNSDTNPYELDSAALGDRVADADFMAFATFRCNKRPLLVLLERGFIQRTLEDEMPPKYIAFLSEMLNRPFEDTGTELLVALCNQVALISQVEFQREKLMDSHVLLPLIELLRSDHDVLLLAVAKALINLSSGNSAAKESIVNEGGVRSLLPHLLTKTEDLTRAFCVLLKNCLTSPDLRERIVNDGAVRPLVQLLHKTEIIGAQRSASVVAAAASAVWNISAHESAKALVIKEHGVEALTEQLQNSTSDDVWQKCAGCLMVLAANSDKVKNLIGEQMGVKALTAIVKQHPSPPVLKATLGALAVLSSDERNLGMMREEGMEQLVEKFMKVKDDRVQIFVKQLRDRLYQTGES